MIVESVVVTKSIGNVRNKSVQYQNKAVYRFSHKNLNPVTKLTKPVRLTNLMFAIIVHPEMLTGQYG